MSSSRSLPIRWITVIFLLLSLGFLGWTLHMRKHAQSGIAELVNEQVALRTSVQRAQTVIERGKRAEGTKKADVAPPLQATGANAKPDIDKILSAHPDLLAMYEQATRISAKQLFGPTYTELKLSPEQIDRLERLNLHDMEIRMDLNAVAESQGLPQNDPTIRQLREQQVAELKQAELNLLGPQSFAGFDAAYRRQGVWDPVEQASRATALSGNPLNGDQAHQLANLMAQSSSDYVNGNDATPRTVDWDSVLTQAQPFLTPSQLDALTLVAQMTKFETLARAYTAGKISDK